MKLRKCYESESHFKNIIKLERMINCLSGKKPRDLFGDNSRLLNGRGGALSKSKTVFLKSSKIHHFPPVPNFIQSFLFSSACSALNSLSLDISSRMYPKLHGDPLIISITTQMKQREVVNLFDVSAFFSIASDRLSLRRSTLK